MASTINASTTAGIVLTPDTSGEISFQSAGVTKAGVNATGLTGDGSQLTGLGGGDLLAANNLSDVADVETSRTNLGIPLVTEIALLNNYSLFVNSTEIVTIAATAATGTINYDTDTQSVVYYTTNAAADWTINFRASSGATLNSVLATGEAITLVHLVTIGASEYRNTTVQVDGAGITPKWQGGAAPTEGNINSIDSYTYTLIKTGDAAFTILAAQTQFA